LTFLAIADDHAVFDKDLVKLAGQTSNGTFCADSLKGGITENCDYLGNCAEKWLREFVSDVDKSLPNFAMAEVFPAFNLGKGSIGNCPQSAIGLDGHLHTFPRSNTFNLTRLPGTAQPLR
jgi:hypothetical protein